MHQVKTRQRVVGKWRIGGGVAGDIKYLVNTRICSLSVLESCMKHCLYVFLCMAVRKCYGKKRRDLELRLYRWTTSEVC